MSKKVKQDRLPILKDYVQSWFKYFGDNITSYNNSMQFLYVNSTSPQEKQDAIEYKKALGTYNVLEAFVSRLIGEFGVSDLGLKILPNDTATDPKIVEALKYILDDIFDYEDSDLALLKDTMGGGFSATKTVAEYTKPMGFDAVLRRYRCKDPTRVGFDPTAKNIGKEDGRFCFEIFPVLLEKFTRDNPNVDTTQLTFSGLSNFDFQWQTTSNLTDKIIFVCDLYERVVERKEINLLSNGQVMTTSEYNKLKEEIMASAEPDVPPVILKKRIEEIPQIVRYRFIESEILEIVQSTGFNDLPYTFIDGNSVVIGNKQYTRPYVKNAIDAQRMKNILGNEFIDSVVNMRKTTLLVEERTLPSEDSTLLPFIKPQLRQGALLWKSYDPDTQQSLPQPTPIPANPINEGLWEAFLGIDNLIQACLGAYDAQLGIQNTDLSGKAIIAGATQSNAAAKPYLLNFIKCKSIEVNKIIDVIPNFYTTPLSIPTLVDGVHRSFIPINDPSNPQSLSLQYEPNMFNVEVVTGSSSEMQKKESLEALFSLQQQNSLLAQLLTQPAGLKILLDNLDVNGVEELQLLLQQFAEQQSQAQQQQSQNPQAQPPDPQMLNMQLKSQELAQKQALAQQNAEQTQQQLALKQIDLQQRARAEQNKTMMAMLQMAEDRSRVQAELANAQDANARADAELRLKQIDTAYRHYKDYISHLGPASH